MRLSQPASASSSKRRKHDRLGKRTKKKHKRLDAICEDEFNRNHDTRNDPNVRSNEVGCEDDDFELRRSSRVRRAPAILDASPSPPRKRQKIEKNEKSHRGSVESLKGKVQSKSESTPRSYSRDSEGKPGHWRSRLRSRVGSVRPEVKEKGGSPRSKRRLYEDFEELKEEVKSMKKGMKDGKGGSGAGKSRVIKSKKPCELKASVDHEAEMHEELKIDDQKHGADAATNEDDPNDHQLTCGTGDRNDEEIVHTCAAPQDGNENGVPNDIKDNQGNGDVKDVPEYHTQRDPFEFAELEANEGDAVEVVSTPNNLRKDEGHVDKDDVPVRPPVNHLEVSNAANMDNICQPSSNGGLQKSRIKEGRRCGLCGGGMDGKPPKKTVHDMVGSDHEAYNGPSSSDEANYDMWDGFGDDSSWLGRLLGPINDRYGIAGVWVHQQCAVWSPEVYFAGPGCLKNVRAALCRGRALKCTRCGRPGATIGCRVDRCPRTYHLPCARVSGSIFDHRKFLIACADHRRHFQPHGYQYLQKIKRLKAKKMKLELRKLSSDACRRDLEAEEKWLEKCGEDEEFLKRESKRLQRDMLRISPVYIGGSHSEGENLYEGWESVAGLQDVIQCMKEVVILPLLYPEFFDNLGLTPPRGVLLHGYPGTGKTLVVRALIGSCARGDRRIAYFARKGADCLGKYVGDAERQLRLLFQVAEKNQPSIIFFDEIDGLAPVRTRQQDQTHSSVVSTLLALMDGLKSRGSVVVIGATNRPDAVDPALRRPGRFDREIYFPLPSCQDRAAILKLHTRKWPKPLSGSLLQWIASRTVGFAGADLQALCAQAAVTALKRNCPLQQILSAAGEKFSSGNRPPLPAFVVEERDWLGALSSAPPPCSRREAGMAANEIASSPLQKHLIPCLLQPLASLLIALCIDESIWLPHSLSKAAKAIRDVVFSAIQKKNLQSDEWYRHFQELLEQSDVANQIVRNLSGAGILVEDAALNSHTSLNNVPGEDNERFEPEFHHRSCFGQLKNLHYALQRKEGCHVLIAGNPRSGQKHLASCLLYGLAGNIEIHKIDAATLSQEGHGDMVQGMTHILTKCARLKSCALFMPRIDLWAIEANYPDSLESMDSSMEPQVTVEGVESSLSIGDVDEKVRSSSPWKCKSERIEEQLDERQSTSEWRSFAEQVESICVSTSLMIMATSEVPYPALPNTVRQFFDSGSSSAKGSVSSERTVPRITVQVDQNLNHALVIQTSTLGLSRDLVQQFVNMLYQRLHSCSDSLIPCSNCKEGQTDVSKTDPSLDVQPKAGTQNASDSAVNVMVPTHGQTVRGKPNLLLAVSTFGYQILLYPHFAELCWVTSKLKEGPYTDICGPWKGWPFNACIVRPDYSSEKEFVTCISSNMKGKEKFSIVRGLVAVGLSAYRGVYTSVTEVALEVRKVLEVLVGQINAKIQAGKDRCQFIRILSQVAYLEDLVNSWAHSLKSLEQDSQAKLLCPKSAGADNPPQVDTEPNGPDGGFVESRPGERSLRVVSSEKPVPDDISEEAGGVGNSLTSENKECIINLDKECPQMVVSDHPIPGSDCQYVAVDQTRSRTFTENNGTRSQACSSDHDTDGTVDRKGLGFLKQSKKIEHGPGKALMHSEVSAGVPSETVSKVSGYHEVCDQSGTSSAVDETVAGGEDKSSADVKTNVSSNRNTNVSSGSGTLCLYNCCLVCVHAIHQLVEKILLKEWESAGESSTVEDIHDFVASASTTLCSAVRKLHLIGGRDYSDSGIFKKSCSKSLELRQRDRCECTSDKNFSEKNILMPMECICHGSSKDIPLGVNSLPYHQRTSGLKFVYRGGVLVPADPDMEVRFHCKYESLCLCSLIESIEITEHTFG